MAKQRETLEILTQKWPFRAGFCSLHGQKCGFWDITWPFIPYFTKFLDQHGLSNQNCPCGGPLHAKA
eukprot:332492-Lingulodinium_polyedra.AAC.1